MGKNSVVTVTKASRAEDTGDWRVRLMCGGGSTEPTSLTAEIKNLRPGHLYRVEVFANNKEGASPPTRLKDPVKAENPYTAPGVPTDVNIVDFDEQSVTLRWCKPTSDGGRPISHYIIQKKDEFGGWFEALITDNDNCIATIAELE